MAKAAVAVEVPGGEVGTGDSREGQEY